MSKELFIIMREQEFNNLEPDVRDALIHVEVREANEWETHNLDPKYKELYKNQQKAKKELQTYLFNKRHQ